MKDKEWLTNKMVKGRELTIKRLDCGYLLEIPVDYYIQGTSPTSQMAIENGAEALPIVRKFLGLQEDDGCPDYPDYEEPIEKSEVDDV